jgi:membrane protein YqaA with SNARE-associated domain
MILKILTVIGLSSFEIYVALAAALGFGFSVWTTLLCTLTGGILGALVSYFLGSEITKWINKTIRKNKEPKPKTGMLFRIWDKYGEMGLSTLGTFFFGAPATMGLAVGFNANTKRMLPIILVVVVLRCFTFTFLGDWIKGLF